jgi:hypothetical protein
MLKNKKILSPSPAIKVKQTELAITENLKVKVLPHIVNDFASALKELEVGESIKFGELGTFKKSQREVNGAIGYQYSFKAGKIVKR